MVNNKDGSGNTEEKKGGDGNGMDLEMMQDERYKNLDPRMVELIENEIMER
jgi:hypothetical protein